MKMLCATRLSVVIVSLVACYWLLTLDSRLGQVLAANPRKDLKLVLESDKKEYRPKDKMVLRLWATNTSDKTLLLNGWMIPNEKGEDEIAPMGTPVLVVVKPQKRDNAKDSTTTIRHLARLKTVSELPPDKNYKTDLFDSNTAFHIPVPLATGKWSVSCYLLLPNPDPKDKATFFIQSNSIMMEVIHPKKQH